ncbi:chaperone protein dnaJ 72-like isoform X2 [Impatiens glandulifera]|uniref:chaperone protein dnaJ 72-like isoform X2 n=1 Tax=Impatiens glandulifera TaxID=253017 RepID=UPI001FB11BE8|nr:chaperone protein dnaJ 72-like isoform X2 [Impatiens glandulifera]
MDYYKVLGLKSNASKEEIKQTFRKLAMQFHPDKHSHSSKYIRDNAAFRFKQISEAYDVLMDDSKRAQSSSYRSNNDTRYTRGYYHQSSGRHGSYGFNNSSSSSSSSAGFGYGYSSPANGNRFMSNVEVVLRFLTTRDFLRTVTFAGCSCYPRCQW